MVQKTLDKMMRTRTLAEVWSSPGAKQMQRRVADTEVGRERSRSKTGGRQSDKSRSGSIGSCGPKRGGRRAGARGARGQRGRGRGGRRWAGTLGQEALQVTGRMKTVAVGWAVGTRCRSLLLLISPTRKRRVYALECGTALGCRAKGWSSCVAVKMERNQVCSP